MKFKSDIILFVSHCFNIGCIGFIPSCLVKPWALFHVTRVLITWKTCIFLHFMWISAIYQSYMVITQRCSINYFYFIHMFLINFICIFFLLDVFPSFIGDKEFSCDLCSYVTPSWSYYERHRASHLRRQNDDKSLVCTICNRGGFAQKSGLLVHLRTHTGEKPFVCNICFKRFSDKSNYRRHLKIH